MFEHIRIVLINTSHPGNIGAAARAMMNMGLSRLYLVDPHRFPHAEATARASGATGILKDAVICATLEEAIADCQLVFASSARSRSLPWPMCTPKECSKQAVESTDLEVALVFGNERAGMTNDQLALAHQHVCIPTVENFSSLNLAQAVQVMVYELFMARSEAPTKAPQPEAMRELSTQGEMQGFMSHLETTMASVDFLDPKHPKLLMKRLQRLFHRAEMDKTELNIMRGILNAVDLKLSKTGVLDDHTIGKP